MADIIGSTTKKAKLSFKREELIYDAENAAYIEGDLLKVDDEHDKHQVYDIAQEGNVDRVNRVLDLAYAECVEMLYPYTKEDSEEENELGNDADETEVYYIDMNIPEGFSKTTLNLLEKQIHEYMVCRVVADWMSITNKNSQSNWEYKLDGIKTKVQSELMSRTKLLRRKLRPF